MSASGRIWGTYFVGWFFLPYLCPIFMAARLALLAAAILFYRCSLDLHYSFFSSPDLRGRLADRHPTLPHIRWWPRFIKFGQKFGCPLPKNLAAQNIKISARFRTPSRLDRQCVRNALLQGVVNGKTALQTTDTHAQANFFGCALVHKRRKIGRSSDPPNGQQSGWTLPRI